MAYYLYCHLQIRPQLSNYVEGGFQSDDEFDSMDMSSPKPVMMKRKTAAGTSSAQKNARMEASVNKMVGAITQLATMQTNTGQTHGKRYDKRKESLMKQGFALYEQIEALLDTQSITMDEPKLGRVQEELDHCYVMQKKVREEQLALM